MKAASRKAGRRRGRIGRPSPGRRRWTMKQAMKTAWGELAKIAGGEKDGGMARGGGGASAAG